MCVDLRTNTTKKAQLFCFYSDTSFSFAQSFVTLFAIKVTPFSFKRSELISSHNCYILCNLWSHKCLSNLNEIYDVFLIDKADAAKHESWKLFFWLVNARVSFHCYSVSIFDKCWCALFGIIFFDFQDTLQDWNLPVKYISCFVFSPRTPTCISLWVHEADDVSRWLCWS